MSLVLDASVALAWLFVRQDPEEAQRADDLLEELASGEALVPPLWHTEVVNALLVGERRGVVREASVADYLGRLGRLPIRTDEEPPSARREAILALAGTHGLTAYDATYLDLALRGGAILATLDEKLSAAMRGAGGPVFGDA